jgi:hypothetical protein
MLCVCRLHLLGRLKYIIGYVQDDEQDEIGLVTQTNERTKLADQSHLMRPT